MGETQTLTEVTSPTISAPPLGKARKILKTLAWMGLGMISLVFFTFLKIPETRLKNFIQATLVSALNTQGITLNAAQTSLSIGFGITYKLKEITLTRATSEEAIQIDEIEFSPSLFPLTFGTLAGKVSLKKGDGFLKSRFWLKNFKTSPVIQTTVQLKKIDLGKLDLADFKHTEEINGDLSFTGDPKVPDTWKGEINVNLSKLILPQQMLAGFLVPSLAITEGVADLKIENAKVHLNKLRLGKAGAQPEDTKEDLIANATGDITLGKTLDSSTLNLKAAFKPSPGVMKAFVLLDALLAPGKQSDGSFAYQLTGPLFTPNYVPVGAPSP